MSVARPPEGPGHNTHGTKDSTGALAGAPAVPSGDGSGALQDEVAVDVDAVIAFARLVMAPGERARLLSVDERGRKVAGEWMDLEAAAHSGQSFMVLVGTNVLALDADDEEQQEALRGLAAEMQDAGCLRVVGCSGRGLHLFAKVDGAGESTWCAAAKELGLDVRDSIRPPLAPHPGGFPVHLVGSTLDEALASLAGPVHGPPPLSRRMRGLLRGKGVARYKSGSEVIQAVLTDAAAKGWTYNAIGWALRGSPYCRGVTSRHARGWLRSSWEKALKWVAANPGNPRSAAARREAAVRFAADFLAALDADVEAGHWTGAGRRRDLSVLRAHLDRVRDLEQLSHVLTVANATVIVGITKVTLVAARTSLQTTGWLRKVSDGTGAEAAVWCLQIPDAAKTCSPTSHTPTPLERRGTGFRVEIDDIGHDAYRWGALNKVGPEVAMVFDAANGVALSGAEIARRCPTKPNAQTVRDKLKLAQASGLVTCTPSGWLAVNFVEDGLDRLAEDTGHAGDRERQIRLNEADRLRRHSERAQWTAEHYGVAPSQHEDDEDRHSRAPFVVHPDDFTRLYNAVTGEIIDRAPPAPERHTADDGHPQPGCEK